MRARPSGLPPPSKIPASKLPPSTLLDQSVKAVAAWTEVAVSMGASLVAAREAVLAAISSREEVLRSLLGLVPEPESIEHVHGLSQACEVVLA